MTDINERINNFLTFANSLDRGFLKRWKANSMIMTLDRMSVIREDHQRMLAYVRNCLVMEGFSDHGCERVTDYLTGERNETKTEESKPNGAGTFPTHLPT